MRALRIVAAIFAAACASFMNVGAQSFSLDSCRNMAIASNKGLKMADQSIAGAGFARKAAYAAYLPAVDFTGSYLYNQRTVNLLSENAKLPTLSFNPATGTYEYNLLKNPETGAPITDPKTGSVIPSMVAEIPKSAMSFDTHNVVVGCVSLLQPVYMGGQIRAMNEITKYAEHLAISVRDAAVTDLIFNVDEAYWTVISLQQKEKLADSYLMLVDTLRSNVDAMVREGVATKSDALKVEVRYNEAQLALTKVKNGLSLSRMALAQICGLPIDTHMQLDESLLASESKRIPAVDYNMTDVYNARPELEALRVNINLSESKAKLAKSAMLPKVAIVSAYTFSNPNVIDGFEKRFGGGFSVGATVSIPIWHWGQNYNKFKVAETETNVQRLALAEAEDMIQLQVKQANFSYQEAYKTYDMTVVNQKNADENLRQARLGFKEGVLTTEDVMAAQTAWLAAHSERIDAEIGISLCNVYLEKVLGRLKY